MKQRREGVGKEIKAVRKREKGKRKKQRRGRIETYKRETVGDISISPRTVLDGALLDK